MTDKRAMIGVVILASLALGGTAMAQTSVLPPASPQGTAPDASTTAAPNAGGLARGVVPPPRNVDPAMVTPPPADTKPSMPVIKPAPTAR